MWRWRSSLPCRPNRQQFVKGSVRRDILIGMRVVIDAAPLLIRSAGVKNYLYHWITHLRRAAGPDVIRTYPELQDLGPLKHDASVAGRWRTATGLAGLALSNYTPLPVLDILTRGADI